MIVYIHKSAAMSYIYIYIKLTKNVSCNSTLELINLHSLKYCMINHDCSRTDYDLDLENFKFSALPILSDKTLNFETT